MVPGHRVHDHRVRAVARSRQLAIGSLASSARSAAARDVAVPRLRERRPAPATASGLIVIAPSASCALRASNATPERAGASAASRPSPRRGE